MGQFNIEQFMPRNSDGTSLSIFNAKFRRIRDLPEVQRVTVDAAYAHNLPTLAYEHLGDVGLWWVLLMFNGLQDPIEDIVPGLVLKIPDKNYLMQMLEAQEATTNVMRI